MIESVTAFLTALGVALRLIKKLEPPPVTLIPPPPPEDKYGLQADLEEIRRRRFGR